MKGEGEEYETILFIYLGRIMNCGCIGWARSAMIVIKRLKYRE